MKSGCFLLCTVLATTALGQTEQPKHPRAELWDKAREATYDDRHKDAAALFQQIEIPQSNSFCFVRCPAGEVAKKSRILCFGRFQPQSTTSFFHAPRLTRAE